MARAAHCTPVHLCRVFKQALDLSPLEYVRLLRLDQAANLLRRSARSLKEIAEATGFYDANHLSKHFKQVYGLSPKDFKASELNEWLTQRNPIFRAQASIAPKV
jgi:transcriptional regulator GlxA family with amidase domain